MKNVKNEKIIKIQEWLQHRKQPGMCYYSYCSREWLWLFKKTTKEFYEENKLKVKITTSRPRDRRANVYVKIKIFL